MFGSALRCLHVFELLDGLVDRLFMLAAFAGQDAIDFTLRQQLFLTLLAAFVGIATIRVGIAGRIVTATVATAVVTTFVIQGQVERERSSPIEHGESCTRTEEKATS